MRLSVELILHATEDWNKVKRAVSNLFGKDFNETLAEGHWENPILLLSANFENEEASELAKKIASSVKVEDFKSRCDKGAFYLRLSKAAALEGKFQLGNDLRVVFHLPGNAKAVENQVRELWGNV